MNANKTQYNVTCIACGSVWTPEPKSSLWWQAHQRATKGFLDALNVSGEKCGCEKKHKSPDAPFRVFGFNDEGREFDIPFTSFVNAVKKFTGLNKDFMATVFIAGVSKAVEDKLNFG